MKTTVKYITLKIDEKLQFVDITSKVKDIVSESGIRNGLVTIFTKHTTSAIRINENETRLIDDMKYFLERLAPSFWRYRHDDIDKRNCPPDERINGHSHLKALLLGSSESIPIINSKLDIGKWQSIFFVDLDGGNRERTISVQVIGEG